MPHEGAPKTTRGDDPHSDEAVAASQEAAPRSRLDEVRDLIKEDNAKPFAEQLSLEKRKSLREEEERLSEQELHERWKEHLEASRDELTEALRLQGDGIAPPEIQALIEQARRLDKASVSGAVLVRDGKEHRVSGRERTTEELFAITKAYRRANEALQASSTRS